MSAHPSAHEEPVASAVAVSEAPTPVVSLRRIAGLVALAAAVVAAAVGEARRGVADRGLLRGFAGGRMRAA